MSPSTPPTKPSPTTPEPPQSYAYWLLSCALGIFPQAQDWAGFGSTLAELLRITGAGIGRTLVRIALLLTFPLSVPALAYMQRRWEARRNQLAAEWADKDL